ncbi:MAG: hypothetical protein U9R38_08085 [Candidatus Margulisiibacteriota bacterium]|nr:hypothetical protein [Candidatus Margulisiibacteriota bacterium]
MKKLLVVLMGLAILASASQAYVFGIETGFFTAGIPYMGFELNDSQRIDVGLNYVSLNNATTLNLVGRFQNKLVTAKKLSAYWAGGLGIASAGNTSTITISGVLGTEYMFDSNIGVYGDVNVLTLQSTSVGGASTTNFYLLQGSNIAVAGLRVYL